MTHYSPKSVAAAIGVSEASLKRWCDRGLLAFSKTAGGHRRIGRADVFDFLRRTGQRVVNPAILDLPANGPVAPTNLTTALAQGHEEQVRREIYDAWLAGKTLAQICDELLAPSFVDLGQAWEHGQVDVYEERRACEICQNVLYELIRTLRPERAEAPLALGATLVGDPYTLPNLMVQLTLRELGWRAIGLGAGLNAETLVRAIERERPRLFWLSVSSVADEAFLYSECQAIWKACQDAGTLLVIGGRALDSARRRQLAYHSHCVSMQDLIRFLDLPTRSAPSIEGS